MVSRWECLIIELTQEIKMMEASRKSWKDCAARAELSVKLANRERNEMIIERDNLLKEVTYMQLMHSPTSEMLQEGLRYLRTDGETNLEMAVQAMMEKAREIIKPLAKRK